MKFIGNEIEGFYSNVYGDHMFWHNSTYHGKLIYHKNTQLDWTEQCFTSPLTQYRLLGDGFYRSKDPTNSSIKVLKEKATKENPENANNKIYTQIRTC